FLKSKRSQFRRLFTKALNDFEKSELDVSIDERIFKLRLIEEKTKPMLEMEETCREELIKTKNNETIINHEFDESECYIDKWRIAESKLASLLAEKIAVLLLMKVLHKVMFFDIQSLSSQLLMGISRTG
ncbi:hypothetical protein AVEN_50304-1, partial [Araneus ventricosus]